MKKILLLCGASQTVLNFRVGLIQALKDAGWNVSASVLDSKYKEEIRALPIDRLFCAEQSNRSLNPFALLRLKRYYQKIIGEIRPDVVMTFMLKPNTLGVTAAHKAGVKHIVSMVEGAGDVFINRGLKWAIVRKTVCCLYKKSFGYSKKIIFLNNDDKAEFIERRLVKEERCKVIPGVGVDLERFAFMPMKNRRTFLMVARMLKTKGVYEYCECARIVKKKYPDAVFNYLGAESTVTLSDIREYIDDGSVNYLGVTKDVRAYLGECTAFILPSRYREGVPMSIMEAEATGRTVITSDNIGCRETVKDGYNGFLAGAADVKKLAEKAIRIIEHPEEAEEMGKNARLFAEEKFDQRKINKIVLSIIGEDVGGENRKSSGKQELQIG